MIKRVPSDCNVLFFKLKQKIHRRKARCSLLTNAAAIRETTCFFQISDTRGLFRVHRPACPSPTDRASGFPSMAPDIPRQNKNPRLSTGIFLSIVFLFAVCHDLDRLEHSAQNRKIFVIGVDARRRLVETVRYRNRRYADRNPEKRSNVPFLLRASDFNVVRFRRQRRSVTGNEKTDGRFELRRHA